MGYKLVWEPPGVTMHLFGHVTGEELLASLIEVEGDARFDRLRFCIRDFLDADSVTVSTALNEEALAHDIGAAMTNPYIRVAVVTAAPEVEALAIQRAAAAGRTHRTRIFSTRRAARAWAAEAQPSALA